MKILILGAKGNLGGQLVKVFSVGNEVIGWDKEEIEVTDKDLITRKISDIKPGIIINATAYNAVDKCEIDEHELEIAEKINGQAVGYLADAAIKNNILLIHYSTDYVFGGKLSPEEKDKIKTQKGYKEDDKPSPINKYGRTKMLGEEELIKRSGKGLKWYLIRTSWLFGPRGESDSSKPSFFEIMYKLSKEKEELNVVYNEKSQFTYSPDLAQATKKLIDDNAGYGIYHITNKGVYSWYSGLKELFKLAGVKTKINPVSGENFKRPAKRPRNSVLINTKLEPMRDLKDVLTEYINYLK